MTSLLGYCVKTFKENKITNIKKASASLFILSLCDKDELEDYKNNIQDFIKTELIPLIKDPHTDTLLLFRTNWTFETFATFLD